MIKPYDKLDSYDKDILAKIGELLIDLAEWLEETGPIPGIDRYGNSGGLTGYENDPNWLKMYNALHYQIRFTKNNMTYENIKNLYLQIIEYDWNDYIDSYDNCRLSYAFNKTCSDAYRIMYGGELDELTTDLVKKQGWEELDAIVYTYLYYLDWKED